MRVTFIGTPGLSEYRGWHDGCFVHLRPGEALEISDAVGAAQLIKDYPGVFSDDIEVPPVDRQIKAPWGRKRAQAQKESQ